MYHILGPRRQGQMGNRSSSMDLPSCVLPPSVGSLWFTISIGSRWFTISIDIDRFRYSHNHSARTLGDYYQTLTLHPQCHAVSLQEAYHILSQ